MRNARSVALVTLTIGSFATAPGRDVLRAAVARPMEQNQPRDLRPGEPRPATRQEIELLERSATSPLDPTALLALAKLQEGRGAVADAEATLLRIRHIDPSNAPGNRALAALYMRSGRFERAVETLEQAATLTPSDAAAHHLIGTYYFEKTRDPALGEAERLTYIQRGLAAEDRALAANPDYLEALVYKNLLLRTQATTEADGKRRETLIAEADALRARALELRQSAGQTASTAQDHRSAPAPPPPPPPPPPPATPGDERPPNEFQYGRTSITVPGSATPPIKIKDVRPVYPPIAIRAGVRGAVVLEATVDERGRVTDARVTRSIPMLDQSAIDAVKGWQFEPRTSAAASGPLVITVTVAFEPER